MANVVVTGSTRGIGLGLVKEFKRLGHNVVVSSRGAAAVDAALAEVKAAAGAGEAIGIACDVSNRAAVQALWDGATNVSELTDAEIKPVLDTNLWGMIYGTQVPLAGMTAQGGGKIFNFEGFGSDGMTAPGLTVYGFTKRALTYFTKSVNKEIKGSQVLLGTISPGIVVTDLLEESKDEDPARWEKTKKMYNILADRVETVVPYLVAEVLKADKPGAAIRWLTTPKAIWRFMTAGITGRKVMPD
jgi:NAD(P)-dependent dehydrogenase (short-subunit alcohol dehydrogenase family)